MKFAIQLLLLLVVNLTAYATVPDHVLKNLPTKQDFGKVINYNRSINEIYYEVDTHSFGLTENGALFLLEEDSSYIYGGERSESAFFPFYQVGDTVTYDFTFKLRKSPAFFSGWSDEWVLFAQWHDQPDPSKGETWATFSKNSPPLSYQLFFDDGLKVGIISRNHQFSFPVELDMPVTCSTTVTWQYPDNGNVQGFCTQGDNTYPFGFNDVVMLNDYYHYFKFGLYRKKSINDFMSIELNELSIY